MGPDVTLEQLYAEIVERAGELLKEAREGDSLQIPELGGELGLVFDMGYAVGVQMGSLAAAEVYSRHGFIRRRATA